MLYYITIKESPDIVQGLKSQKITFRTKEDTMQDLTVSLGTMSKMQPSATLAIAAKAKALKAAGEKVVSMSAGEPDFDTPDYIKQAAIDALLKGDTKYTPSSGTLELRKVLAAKFERENGIKTTPEQIVASPGAKFSCFLAVCALCGPGDEVLLPSPYWLSYPEMITASGATIVPVPTSAENNYEVDLAVLESLVTERTKLMILNTPSNPTGAVYRRETLEKIADLAVRKNFMILSDEIYEKLVYDAELPHVSIASLNPQIAELTITVNGFAKAYAMPGWRLGYLTAPLWLSKRIAALQSHSTSNPTSFIQPAAIVAIEQGGEDVEKMRQIFAKRRDLICELLKDVPKCKAIRPQGSFYVLIDISETGLAPTVFCERLINEQKMACVPCEDFGAATSIRLSYACSDANIKECVSRLKTFIESL